MDQISGALVGIGLVLSAVFLPMFFFGGSAGVIYRQFSITIVTAMTLSVLVALIFTPALCATILRRPKEGHGPRRGFFGLFNRGFERTREGYAGGVRRMTARPLRYMLIYLVIVVGMGAIYLRLPSSFLPNEDQGVMFIQVTAPPGATIERTQRAVNDVTHYLLNDEKDRVSSVFSVVGFSFGGRGQNAAIAFVKLKDWSERKHADDAVGALAGRVMGRFATFPDAQIFAFAPPAVSELGNATGFDMQLINHGNLPHRTFTQARDQLLQLAAGSPILRAVRANDLADEPQYRLEIDWERASALGLSIADINSTMSTAIGSEYAGDFLDRNRIKRIYVQGDASSRMLPSDLEKWHVRNASGQMVPFSAFATAKWEVGSPKLSRYNGVGSIEILGDATPGSSTGTAMAEMERLVAQLPSGLGVDWTGLSYEERQSGSQAYALYGISVLVVFLCLAALYESWAIPVSVMLVVPLGIFGAVAATMLRGMSNDVYFQVALLTTVGLSAKNAILIVEFAKEHFEQGESLVDAALHAAYERLRPIIMTSMAFILGVTPLAISTGAGAGGQNAIGTGIVGGVLTGTILAVFFVPVFFVLVLRLFRTQRKTQKQTQTGEQAPSAGPGTGI